MKVCVINGSPKGENSVTLQSIAYLQKHFAKDEFEVFNVGAKIKSYEQPENMGTVLKALQESELIIFAYPVYTFLAPYQLHRFIELLQKENLTALKGKSVAQITTSKHFFDTTAHAFVSENCKDMSLFTLPPFSADMEDLLTENGRKELINYYKYVQFAVYNTADTFNPTPSFEYIYTPFKKVTDKKEGFDTVLVTDVTEGNISLKNMIEDFVSVYPYKVRIINLNDLVIKSGCLGCFSCASSGKCIINDGFDAILRGQIQTADATIIAADISCHSLGSMFKKYDDRNFCNGHRTLSMGKPVGYILNGNYSFEKNIQTVLEARADVGRNFFAGVACSQSCEHALILDSIENLSAHISYALENKLTLPQTFYGVGGMKIFRDLIYIMRGLMKEDHKFYKENNFYDFPQKKKGTLIKMQLVGALMSNKTIAKKGGKFMNEAILQPYKKAIKEN